MEVITLSVGEQQTNCYLLVDEATQKTIIIDPADEADFISTTILEKKLIPEAILLTHGHYDHCMGALELKLNFNIPIYLHNADLFLYSNANKSASFWNSSLRGGTPTRQSPTLKLPLIDFFLTDNQTISFGESSLKVIHTPGHTPGSCCFISPSVIGDLPAGRQGFGIPNRGNPSPPEICIFTGDTLFASGPGAADRSYSSKTDLQSSIANLRSVTCNLQPKADPPLVETSTVIYPGHESSCIFQEIENF